MSYWVETTLESLGLTGTLVKRGQELQSACPYPEHDDRHPSFYVNLETGRWICHAGCGAGGLFELTQLLEAQGRSPQPSQNGGRTPEAELSPFLARGLTPTLMAGWGLRWNDEMAALEIPCHAADGRFIGYIWRAGDANPAQRYKYPPNFPKSRILFGLNRIIQRKEVVLTEGSLDAIWLQAAGVPGVGLLGSHLSSEQLAELVVNGCRLVTLCFDADEAGRAGAKDATVKLRKAGCYVFRVELPSACKDIQEVALPKVAGLLAARHLAINGSGVVGPRYRRWLSSKKGV